MLRAGQKVVCINDDPGEGTEWLGDKPVKDRVYTVLRTGPAPSSGKLNVWLYEIVNSDPTHPSIGYRASRFRPVVDRPTDISVFTKMLDQQPVLA